MYRNIQDLIKQIVEDTQPTLNISIADICDGIYQKIGIRPSRTTVKRHLDELGIKAAEGKKRTWAYLHNPNAGDE
jgi:DNA-directed RNA polymerase specialized sigma54-like protein